MLGTEVDALSFSETMDAIVEIIETGTPTQHLAMNAAKVVLLRSDPVLRAIASECGIISADGVPLVWASRLLGHPLPGRVNGTDLMEALCDLAGEREWSVYFFGARPDVVKEVARWGASAHPGLRVAGIRDGYFTESESKEIVSEIASSGASIVFLGFPTPKKELWLHRHLHELNVPFCMGVGGSFDVIAGTLPRAPRWMQRNGLEWLFRFVQEPKRMWKRYLVGNTKFVVMVLVEFTKQRLRPSA
ncbi:MAG: WecB/TagA/CpsF family glycosyltransferase [Actinomycetota bacterium]|nr:WecB/TagA/CpsF family glycosyltransferase [Actinomycetota bacterium]